MAGVGGGKENSREKVVHCSEGAPYWWRSAGGSILIFSDSYIICHKSIVKYLPRDILRPMVVRNLLYLCISTYFLLLRITLKDCDVKRIMLFCWRGCSMSGTWIVHRL